MCSSDQYILVETGDMDNEMVAAALKAGGSIIDVDGQTIRIDNGSIQSEMDSSQATDGVITNVLVEEDGVVKSDQELPVTYEIVTDDQSC